MAQLPALASAAPKASRRQTAKEQEKLLHSGVL